MNEAQVKSEAKIQGIVRNYRLTKADYNILGEHLKRWRGMLKNLLPILDGKWQDADGYARIEEYKEKIVISFIKALNLSLNASYPTAENISSLILRASMESRNLALNGSILSPEIMPELINKANAEARILNSLLEEKSI